MDELTQEKRDFARLSMNSASVRIQDYCLEDPANDEDSVITHHPGYSVLKHRAQSPIRNFRSPQKLVRVSKQFLKK
jgi:hypothetical protein